MTVFRRVAGPLILATSVLSVSGDSGFWIDPDVISGGLVGNQAVVRDWGVSLFSDDAAEVCELVAARRDERAAGRWDGMLDAPVEVARPGEGSGIDRIVDARLFEAPLRVGPLLWGEEDGDAGLPVALFVWILAGTGFAGLAGAFAFRRMRGSSRAELIGEGV
jgi:hypothetical protein